MLFKGKPPFIVGALYSYLPAGTQLDMKTRKIASVMWDFGPYVDVIQHGPSMSLKTRLPLTDAAATEPPASTG